MLGCFAERQGWRRGGRRVVGRIELKAQRDRVGPIDPTGDGDSDGDTRRRCWGSEHERNLSWEMGGEGLAEGPPRKGLLPGDGSAVVFQPILGEIGAPFGEFGEPGDGGVVDLLKQGIEQIGRIGIRRGGAGEKQDEPHAFEVVAPLELGAEPGGVALGMAGDGRPILGIERSEIVGLIDRLRH